MSRTSWAPTYLQNFPFITGYTAHGVRVLLLPLPPIIRGHQELLVLGAAAVSRLGPAWPALNKQNVFWGNALTS